VIWDKCTKILPSCYNVPGFLMAVSMNRQNFGLWLSSFSINDRRDKLATSDDSIEPFQAALLFTLKYEVSDHGQDTHISR
jgi:hypothetical protein